MALRERRKRTPTCNKEGERKVTQEVAALVKGERGSTCLTVSISY